MSLGAGRLVAAVLFVALSSSPFAFADDPEASQPPTTSGPLVGLSLPCEDAGSPGPGEMIGQSCSWSYDLLPAESNATEDYSAYWVQIEVDPGKGECARMILFEMDAPGDGRIVSAVPDKTVRSSEAHPATTELIVDGGGTAPVPGAISKEVIVPTGKTTVDFDEDHYSAMWWGKSRDKVMIAFGVQYTHTSVPPELFYSWSESQGMGGGSCRPITLRVRGR